MTAEDTICVKAGEYPPTEPASDKRFIKHVRCESGRFHVLYWDSNGCHCSEPKCIINKR